MYRVWVPKSFDRRVWVPKNFDRKFGPKVLTETFWFLELCFSFLGGGEEEAGMEEAGRQGGGAGAKGLDQVGAYGA